MMLPLQRVLFAALCLVSNVVQADTSSTCPVRSTSYAPDFLMQPRTVQASVPGHAFGIAYATQADKAFVVLGTGSKNGTLGVLDVSTLTPTLLHQIHLPAPSGTEEGNEPLGIALTSNGGHAIIAYGTGAVIVDTALAVSGNAKAVVGTLSGGTGKQSAGSSAIEITISPDDKYVFVSQEYGTTSETGGNIQVFKLQPASADGSISGKSLGFITLPGAVVGSALSPSGQYLYATTQPATADQGHLSVLDVKTLESKPSEALVARVVAYCDPVRVIVSSDGQTLWVTSRANYALYAFDAAKVLKNATDARIASITVGAAPVGLIFYNNETRILIAASNRYYEKHTVASLTVVDVAAALRSSKSAVLGQVATGLFPRQLSRSADGSRMLLSNYDSLQVQAIDLGTLP